MWAVTHGGSSTEIRVYGEDRSCLDGFYNVSAPGSVVGGDAIRLPGEITDEMLTGINEHPGASVAVIECAAQ